MIDVIIPYNFHASRERGREIVEKSLRSKGFNIVYGHSKIWNKPLAILDGFKKSHSEVIIIHDADILCSLEDIEPIKGKLIIPFNKLFKMRENNTIERVKRYKDSAGGIWIMYREDFIKSKGPDPRFTHGLEDRAFCYQFETLVGEVVLLNKNAIHIYHEKNTNKLANYDLYIRYLDARGDKEKMEALIAERDFIFGEMATTCD